MAKKIKEISETRKKSFQFLCQKEKLAKRRKPRTPPNLEIFPRKPKNLWQIPKSWEWLSLQDISSIKKYSMSSGPFGSALGTKDYRENGIPVIRGANIKNGKFVNKKFVFITEQKAKELIRSFVYPNDIVIIAVGFSGNSTVIPQSLEFGILSQNCNKFSLDFNLAIPEFVNQFLQLEITKENMKTKTTDTARPFLSLTNLKTLLIPIPPVQEQTEMINQLRNEYDELDNLEIKLQYMKSKIPLLRILILKNAFEGKLVPQDPNDEPAEILLQKIKQEKEQLIQNQKAPRRKKNV